MCAPSAPCVKEGVNEGVNEETTCVVGRCRPKKDALLAMGTARRLVLAPDAIAVISEHGPSGGGVSLPETVSFGARTQGGTTLLLHFGLPMAEKTQVVAAFLVLEPLPFASPPGAPVLIELSRIVEPWRPDFVSWGRHPSLGVSERAGIVAARPPSTLRLDVTPLVRAWAERRPDEQGLALLAEPNDAYGATYSLGVSAGKGPTLEVYVR